MECTLSPESTKILDRILRVTYSDYIVLDTCSSPTFISVSSNFSHYTLVRFETGFFDAFIPLGTTMTIPYQKFYLSKMKYLNVLQNERQTLLEYECSGYSYQKRICNVENDPVEVEFEVSKTLSLDLSVIKRIIRNMKAKRVTLEVGEELVITCPGTRAVVETGLKMENMKFVLELECLQRVLSLTDLFNESMLLFPKEPGAIGILFRNADIMVNTYLAG